MPALATAFQPAPMLGGAPYSRLQNTEDWRSMSRKALTLLHFNVETVSLNKRANGHQAASTNAKISLLRKERINGVNDTADRDGDSQQDLTRVHAELIRKIAADKDRDAFQVLYSWYAPRVKSYLLRFKLNAEQAEDLAQEIMVTLWRKAVQYDPAKAAPSTWIFRIARNRFIDQTRKQKYPEVDADDHLQHLVAPETADQPVIDRQVAVNVKAALNTLNADQRQVIELSFFEEMSHSQIAEHLSLPLGTVKSRIRLAFKALRPELESQR